MSEELKQLMAAVADMEAKSHQDCPDETVRWAIDELSEAGEEHLLQPIRNINAAYRKWKETNP